MTILEAITIVLRDAGCGLTCKEITDRILAQNLYQFKAASPSSIVNHDLRRRCIGLDFPSAHPVKHFEIVPGGRGKAVYRLINSSVSVGTAEKEQPGGDSKSAELLPVERMQRYYEKHCASVREQLLECILSNDPAFFESLVVNLLLELGYGHGADAGRVVGKSHDGGIDGIINEDKLGLDKIYIQAKRYNAKRAVGREELQKFVGAMKSVKKGVFITTSSFTPLAIEYAKDLHEKNISLIDGAMLSELMVEYRVGVKVINSYETYEIDTAFFEIS